MFLELPARLPTQEVIASNKNNPESRIPPKYDLPVSQEGSLKRSPFDQNANLLPEVSEGAIAQVNADADGRAFLINILRPYFKPTALTRLNNKFVSLMNHVSKNKRLRGEAFSVEGTNLNFFVICAPFDIRYPNGQIVQGGRCVLWNRSKWQILSILNGTSAKSGETVLTQNFTSEAAVDYGDTDFGDTDFGQNGYNATISSAQKSN